MRDRARVWFGLLMLLAATLACNAFAGQPETGLPPPPLPTGVGAAVPAATAGPAGGATGVPGLAPTATLPGLATPAPGQGVVRILVDLNVRAGPGVGFRRVGFLLRDDMAVVLGRDEATGWWRIECPPDADGEECWVSGGSRYTRAQAVSPTATP